MPQRKPPHDEGNSAAERRLQVGAALVLGVLALIGIVVRADLRNMLPVGWWRPW